MKTWNEANRLEALNSYSILDTPKEDDFEEIVRMAAEACNVPVAVISFVATDRQWFKARIGIEATETALDVSICSHAILQRDLFVVPDTTKDSRFANNSLVTGDPNFRFYAGALLETPEGLPLGTVCVLDYQPRTLSEKEASSLKALARQVMTQLELRRLLSELRGALKAKSDSEERLKLALARSEFLSHLTQRLSTVTDAEEISRTATRAIGEFLGVHRCYFFQSMSEQNRAHVLPSWCKDSDEGLVGDYVLDDYGEPELIQALKQVPVSINDVKTHPWTLKALSVYESIKILAYTYAPFIHEGHWVACVGVSSDHARQWTDDEKALLENAVARVWPLIERARAEGALRQAQEALRNANNLLGDKASHLESVVQQRTAKLSETIDELEAFSYSISHDMRAPLRAMRAFADILRQEYTDKLDPSGCDLLNRISQASRRMDQLIQDVLSFSQVSRKDVTLQPVDPNQLLNELINSYPNLSPFVLDVSIPAPLPSIKGNEALLTQCFSNLLDNAAKFGQEGRKPHVTITAEKANGRVKLSLQDNGIGMPAHSLERVFNIFQRVGRESTGTGIGLAIVRKAVEKMGGTTGAASELGHGSHFWLNLEAT